MGARHPNQWTAKRGSGGMIWLTVVAFDQQTGRQIASISSEFSQTDVANYVRDLCREAGLPSPWGRR